MSGPERTASTAFELTAVPAGFDTITEYTPASVGDSVLSTRGFSVPEGRFTPSFRH